MELQEFMFTDGGHSYRCHVESVGVTPAIASWMVEVDGALHYWAIPAAADETEDEVKRRVIEWDQARRS